MTRIPIYENPNHPNYGPVRRLWVVLAQLGMLEKAEEVFYLRMQPWDVALSMNLDHAENESEAQRWVIGFILRYGYGVFNDKERKQRERNREDYLEARAAREAAREAAK